MTAVERAAGALAEETRRTNERRVLVLSGGHGRCRDAAVTALEAATVDPAETTYLGSGTDTPWERVEPNRAAELLGTTHEAIVLDCHDECRPNALGRAVGAVDGGGLLVLLAPPLDSWPDRRDGFDESLAVPPFEVGDVTGRFRERLVDLVLAHRGVAVVDVDEGRVVSDGLTDPAPRLPADRPSPPDGTRFPARVYERCRTDDQVEAVAAFEDLTDSDGTDRSDGDSGRRALVVEADRGRGKSSAAGLAAGALALEGRSVLVTAPTYRNAAEVFARAEEVLVDHDALGEREGGDDPRRLEAERAVVRFERPPTAVEAAADADLLVVDEAAALPVRVLERCLDAPAVAFATTVHGYEGAGRGFSVRFRERLAGADHAVTDLAMTDPVRYAAGDPVEVWAVRALLLDARPAAEQLVEEARPGECAYRSPGAEDLLADEHLLREAFGLLVLAHYRTEPDDLARVLDAPNVSVRALTWNGRVVSVALLAAEGDLPADLRARMYEGERVRGNMIPDVLTSQLRDEAAGVPAGQRILRVATHPAVRSRGLGSRLLGEIRGEFEDEVDWLGTGYGATPELLSFWRANGFGTVHLSTRRNETSGEHSAIMLDPTSEAGRDLHARHAAWFTERVEGMLSDPLSGVDPDVVRATLASVDATPPVDLSDQEWRVAAGLQHGASIFDTAPRAVRRLALRHLVDAGTHDGSTANSCLTAREERLLVLKALQGHPWSAVADRLDFRSRAECMRALGDAVGPLVSRFGDSIARTERERFE